jgi:hypothetical protein
VNHRVVEEIEWADEKENGVIDQGESLIEASRNDFAQTKAGTVCYFGEQSTSTRTVSSPAPG